MMSRIIMSTWTGRSCTVPSATVFFDTTAPRVRMYDSSNAPDTNRWMRLVLPTPSSPTRQILNLKVFCSNSVEGLRIIAGVVAGRGFIKPSTRFSELETDRLEPVDIRDRPGPGLPRLERGANRHSGTGPGRGNEEPVEEATADSLEADEPPDL